MTNNHGTSDIRHQTSDITLAVVIARAGSKGLPMKNTLPLGGKPMVAWTLEHALASKRVDKVVLSTDGPAIAAAGRKLGVEVIDRPAELAGDTATVDSAVRHAVICCETASVRVGIVVILYGNVPLRPSDLTDRAVAKLIDTGADSVQSVCPVGKVHPYWMKTLAGPPGSADTLEMYLPNKVYRRQELPPVYMLDGGVIAVTRKSLFNVDPAQPHAFLGENRRAVTTREGEVVDVDSELDFRVAEALLQSRNATTQAA